MYFLNQWTKSCAVSGLQWCSGDYLHTLVLFSENLFLWVIFPLQTSVSLSSRWDENNTLTKCSLCVKYCFKYFNELAHLISFTYPFEAYTLFSSITDGGIEAQNLRYLLRILQLGGGRGKIWSQSLWPIDL